MIINMIGVPLFFGSDRKGVDEGPNKLRENGLEAVIEKYGHYLYDLGNLFVKNVDESHKFSTDKRMKYIDEIVDVNTNLAHQVYCSLKSGCFPLVIGGDHSLGLGSVTGASKYYDDLGVIWIDAHGDINTHETTATGNVHGMPLSAAMGFGYDRLVNLYYDGPKVKKENVFIVGARDLDDDEIEMIEKMKLNVWTTDYIKEHSINKTMDEVFQKLKERDIDNIHVSFDIDVLDKALVPGTGTPVEKGITTEDAKSILRTVLETGLVRSMDIVELNSRLDKGDATLRTTMNIIDFCFSIIK
ncbi:MAG: arginase [Bacillota bacterium]|nr:arginase [Bacillota bacterium]